MPASTLARSCWNSAAMSANNRLRFGTGRSVRGRGRGRVLSPSCRACSERRRMARPCPIYQATRDNWVAPYAARAMRRDRGSLMLIFVCTPAYRHSSNCHRLRPRGEAFSRVGNATKHFAENASAHARRGRWFDLVHHAHFAGPGPGIFVLLQVFLRERIDVRVRPLLGDALDTAADRYGLSGSMIANATGEPSF